MFATYFLKLLLAHLLVRFTVEARLQTTPARLPLRIRRLGAPATKGGVAILLLGPELHAAMLLSVAVFVLSSSVIDWLERRSARPAWASFSSAQVAHVATCAGVAAWWATGGNLDLLNASLRSWSSDVRVLWVVTVYFATIFAGGTLVQNIAGHFGRQFNQTLADQKPGLQDAGKYIGWLERFLIVTFVLGNFGDAIGFLLAAKALVRYPEIKDDKGLFAEYFLIGTLTSVGLALLAGFLLRWAVARP